MICKRCGSSVYALYPFGGSKICGKCVDESGGLGSVSAKYDDGRESRKERHERIVGKVIEAILEENRERPDSDMVIACFCMISEGSVFNVRKEYNIPPSSKRGHRFDYKDLKRRFKSER